MSLPSPLCWLRAALHFLRCPVGAPISGHACVEEGTWRGCEVQVLRCVECGKVSIGWSGGEKVV